MNKKLAKSKIGITSLVLVFFLLIGLVPLTLVSYVSAQIAKRTQQHSVMEKLSAVSTSQAEVIEGFGREKLKNLESISRMPFVIDFIESITTEKSKRVATSNYVNKRSLMEKYRTLYGFHDILIINLDGDVVFSLVEERDLGTNLLTGPFKDTALAEVYTRAMNYAEVRISDYRYYAPSDNAAIFIARRVLGESEHSKTVAIIAIQLTGDEINHAVNNYSGLGRTGETVLGKKEEGRFVFVNSLRHDLDAAFTRAGKMGDPGALPMQQALLQENGSGLSIDYRGIEVLAVWKYLPLWRWGMVVKVDIDEAYKATSDYLYIVRLMTIVAIVAIITLVVFVSRLARKPLQELVHVTSEIADGKLDIRAPDMGIAELSNLSMSFNKMATKIAAMIQGRDAELSVRVKTQTKLDEQAKSLVTVNAEMAGKIVRLDKSRKAMFYMIDDLNRVSNSLKMVNKELEAFSYSISHDLRAPLRAMDGFSRALLEDYTDELDAQGKDFLERICVASQGMSVLIDDLLGLSRITRQELNISKIDLNPIAKAITDKLREGEPERQAEIVIEKKLTLLGDNHLARIMLENLLGNAWKFTANESQTKISLGATKIKGKKTFYVRDNGTGFDMIYAGKIFDAFQRLHATSEFEGSGIGLAIVQRIVNRHGGTIWVESKLDEGTTIFFNLG